MTYRDSSGEIAITPRWTKCVICGHATSQPPVCWDYKCEQELERLTAATCPGCGYKVDGPVWGPDSLCRDCYEAGIPEPYCQHGTYIGYPGGPDYLCGACEMGE